jgi:hypothetical protein
MDENIRRDIEEYEKAGSDFAEYVKGNYDSSADYWRIIKDASGKVVKVLDDGDEKHATVVNHNGVVEKTVELNNSSLTAQLAAVAGNGMNKSEMNRIMMDSHLDYNGETKSWFAKDTSGTYTPPESAESAPAAAESKPLSAWERAKAKGRAALDFLGTKFDAAGEALASGAGKVLAFLGIPTKISVSAEAPNAAIMDAKKILENEPNPSVEKKSGTYPSQKEIGRMLGLPENSTCLVSSWLYLYMNDNPDASLETALEIAKNQIGVSITSLAFVEDQNRLSNALAQGLGKSKYGDKIFQYPYSRNKDTDEYKQIIYSTEKDFYDSIYSYAIYKYAKIDSPEETHFTFAVRKTKTEIDPWPGGISTTWDPKSYELKAIMPLGLYPKPKYLQ